MAGTVTIEETSPPAHSQIRSVMGPFRRIKWTWTSDASGDADLSTTYSYAGIPAALTTDPSASPQPLDNYDIVITDKDGFDVLGGQGANRDNVNTETVKDNAAFRYFTPSTLDFVLSNAGNAKEGVAILWIKTV